MRRYLLVLIVLFAMVDLALGAVGDASVSDGSSATAAQSYQVGAAYQAIDSSGYLASSLDGSWPAAAPTPPDLNSENLVLPDFNLYKPASDQMGYASQGGQSYAIQETYSGAAASYPIQSGYPAQSSYAVPYSYPVQSSNPAKIIVDGTGLGSNAVCSACTGVSGSAPVQGSCPSCTGSAGLVVPSGYVPQSYHAVYPGPSACRCYEYYVQALPGKISTVAGVRCGDWLPLWSKMSRAGMYWSFEWTLCGSPSASYCSPEVKNLRYKGPGWCQTWFIGNKPGWHILSYYCNDWSNYIYIYVWPSS